jgi:hypothetical protein
MRPNFLIAALLLAPSLAAAQISIRNGIGADTINQLQQLIQKNTTPAQQAKLQQGLVSGVILSCVEKKTGAEAAQRYYKELDMVGKQVESYCKANQPDMARQLVLQNLTKRQHDAPLIYAQQCYDSHTNDIASLPEPARSEVPKYVAWSRDPAAAQREMTDRDVCHNARGS